jgi:hypothetical protein
MVSTSQSIMKHLGNSSLGQSYSETNRDGKSPWGQNYELKVEMVSSRESKMHTQDELESS